MKKLHIVGDSHVVAIESALIGGSVIRDELFGERVSVAAGKLFSYPMTQRPFHRTRRNVLFRKPDVKEKLALLTGSDQVRSVADEVYYFCFPYTTSLLIWDETWRTIAPWRAGPAVGGALSDGAVWDLVDERLTHIYAFLADVRARNIAAAIVESPPLREDDRAISVFKIKPEIVLEVDRLARERIDRRLAEMGLDVIRNPSGAYAGDARRSFLKEEYWTSRPNDHHAGAAYGAIMLEEIAAHFGRAHA